MPDTDVLDSHVLHEEADLHVDLDLLEVMLDLDPGMLVWTPCDRRGHGSRACLHIFEAFNRDGWRRIATPESRARLSKELAPIVMGYDSAKHLDPDSVHLVDPGQWAT